MERLKDVKLKLLFSFVLMFFIALAFSNVNAYQIETIVKTKEELSGGENFPNMIYRKQVSAVSDLEKEYEKAWKNKFEYGYKKYKVGINIDDMDDAGWVYSKEVLGEQDDLVEETYTHNKWNSFNRVYEYFHKYQNSVYITENNDGNGEKYYSTGPLSPGELKAYNLNAANVYNVTEETENYSGLFWSRAYQRMENAPYGINPITYKENENSDEEYLDLATVTGRPDHPIVMINSDLYRYAVTNAYNVNNKVHGVYVSDNIFTEDTLQKLRKKFGEEYTGKEMTVYVSSVLRTNSANAKNGEKYYKYMDTAFKFWECSVRGNPGSVPGKPYTYRAAWAGSASITGKEAVETKGASSVINYYDNTFVFPVGNTKNIYIRHIDVTGLSAINSSTVSGNSRLITDIDNGQLIECDDDSVLEKKIHFVKYNSPSLRNSTFSDETEPRYSEMYTVNPDLKDWVVGNIKYNNSDDYVDSDGNSKTVTYLNSEDGIGKTANEQDILTNYNCVGRAVGYGDSISLALKDKDENLDATTNWSELGGDYSNVYVSGGVKEDYIIVDFYYEKKPTEVYVRHIDVSEKTNIADKNLTGDKNSNKDIFLQTEVGAAFKVNSNTTWDFSLKDDNGNYIMATATYDVNPSGSRETYQESYVKEAKDILRIANIKYNHSTAGSYWNLLSDKLQKDYEKYYCIGAAVGMGATVNSAEEHKNEVKKEQLGDACNLTDFIKLSSEGTIKKDDRLIEKNDDYTSIVLDSNNYNVVVIDFYYASEPAPPNKNQRLVYVRHLDMTGKSINYDNAQDAVTSGNTLPGNGKATKFNNNYTCSVSATSVSKEGYKERYNIAHGYEIKVDKYNSDDYTCVGSNIVGSTIDFAEAKGNMDALLKNGQYSSESTSSRRTNEIGSNNVVILIDFYYQSKHTGTALERPTKGRLSFYTLSSMESDYKKISGKDSTNSNINNPSGDNDDVIDVVPSGETLKMSIDNAYTYMLGGINIKEQKIKDIYTFEYTITQKYTVTYLKWSSECSGPCERKQERKKRRGMR